MIARMEEGIGEEAVDDASDTAIARPARRVVRTREPGLDLICTKVAVDFQSITLSTADERINDRAAVSSPTRAAPMRFSSRCSTTSRAPLSKVYLGPLDVLGVQSGSAEG